MKLRYKIMISILAGVIAMTVYSSPMWWGVFFSPITRQLTTAEVSEVVPSPGWEDGGVSIRFKSLELLLSFFHFS